MNTQKIIREPGSGKTRELMQIAVDNNAIFVCKNPEAMQVKAKAYGLSPAIIKYIDYITDKSYIGKKVCIDDIDEFLETMYLFDVVAIGGNS